MIFTTRDFLMTGKLHAPCGNGFRWEPELWAQSRNSQEAVSEGCAVPKLRCLLRFLFFCDVEVQTCSLPYIR